MAGITTTQGLISNSLFHLERFPDQRDLLRREPERMTFAIEELLRFEAPLQTLARTATRDVEAFDTVIPKGARVGLVWAPPTATNVAGPSRTASISPASRPAMSRSGRGSTTALARRWPPRGAGRVRGAVQADPGLRRDRPDRPWATPADRLFESLPVEFEPRLA